jgi:hypothetical protein
MLQCSVLVILLLKHPLNIYKITYRMWKKLTQMTRTCRIPQNKKTADGQNSMEVVVTEIHTHELLSNGTTVQ